MKKLLIVIIGLMALLPSQIFAFNIKSEHAILYNLNEDSVLYEVKPNEKVAIASLTKIMTALVVVENVKNLDAEFVMTKDMYKTLIEENASVAGFQIGETVTYRELLYGLLLPSGAEAAQGLAIKTSGSIENFVVLMNKKAKELGLKNTSFANPTGLDHKDNYSTVSDVAILLKYALKNKDFKEVFTTRKYTTKNKRHTFYATIVKNNMDTTFIKGSKTGFTYDAGLCLASISSYNGVNYLLVTAKAPYSDRTTHIKDAKTIYGYYFKNYEYKEVTSINDLITKVTLEDGRVIEYYNNLKKTKYLKKDCNLKKEYIGKTEVTKTDKVGTKLGEYVVKCDDEIVYQKNIYLTQNIQEKKKIDYKIIAVVSIIVLLFIKIITSILGRKK